MNAFSHAHIYAVVEENPPWRIRQEVEDRGWRRADGQGNNMSRGAKLSKAGHILEQKTRNSMVSVYIRPEMWTEEHLSPSLTSHRESWKSELKKSHKWPSMITFLKTMLNAQWMWDRGGERYCKTTTWTSRGKQFRVGHGCERQWKAKLSWLFSLDSCMKWPDRKQC